MAIATQFGGIGGSADDLEAAIARELDRRRMPSRLRVPRQSATTAPPPAAPAATPADVAAAAAGGWDATKDWLGKRTAGINRFLLRPGVLAAGGIGTGLAALGAGANAMSNLDPAATDAQKLAAGVGGVGGDLATRFAGGALGFLLTGGNPLGAAVGSTLLPMVVDGAGAGASVANAITGAVSPSPEARENMRRTRAAETDLNIAMMQLPYIDAMKRGEMARNAEALRLQENLLANQDLRRAMLASVAYQPSNTPGILDSVF